MLGSGDPSTNFTETVKINRVTPGTTNTVAPISGQDGVDGGAGATTAKTQRMVMADDVGSPTDRPLTYSNPTKHTATSASTTLVAASSGLKTRLVKVFVPATAVGGIHIALGADPTVNNWFIPPGGYDAFNTIQDVRVIRAGATDVVFFVQTAVA